MYNAGRTIARHSAHIKKAKADSNSWRPLSQRSQRITNTTMFGALSH